MEMLSACYKPGRVFLCRAKHKSGLLRTILDFAKAKKIKTASFDVIGSVADASLAYYDQSNREYQKVRFKKPMEIAGCWGNLSFKDGKPFAHAHAVLSDKTGRTYGGHLIKATVFAAEIHIQELLGDKLEREYDQTTGLALWNFREG